MGWPKAIEPPLTFTFSGSTPSSFTCCQRNALKKLAFDKSTHHSKGLRCKGLIELPQVDLVNCPASFCKSGSYCGDWSGTHESRFDA